MLAGAMGVLLAAASTLVAGPEDGPVRCACDGEGEPGFGWRGPAPSLSKAELAGLAAPALCFSTEEPLLGEGPLHARHPCDPHEGAPVVYHRLESAKLRSSAGALAPDAPGLMERASELLIRYFFCYPSDAGVVAICTTWIRRMSG